MKLRWIIFTLILATLLVSAVQPVLAQAEMERSGLRPDAPEYAVRGPHWVGYKPLVIGEGLKAGLWYPALNPESEMEEVAYEFTITTPDWRPEEPTVVYGRALLDAPIDGSSGPYPLVIFSHGFTLNPEWYSTLPEHYASHGFIVLAPQHTEQFDMDWSEIAPASIDRPLDIKQTLDYAEEINASGGDFAEQIDMENVAVVGHSYGGYTALAMAGAQYDMEAFTERCASLPEDDPAMFLCTPLVGKEEFLAEKAGLEEVPEGLWPTLGDSRVTAIVPLAGDSYLFDEAGLAKITVPMMAIGGTADTATPYFWGSKPSYEYASSAKKVLVTLTGAEHMFMSSLCKDMPWISSNPFYEFVCFDPVWDKPRSLDLVHHFSTAFLLDTLKDDQAAYAVLAPEAVSFPGIEYEAEGYGPAVEIAEPAPPVTKRSALAAVNDIILYYEIVGEGEPLLLLNGGTGCTESWAWGNQYEALGQHYTLIAPDSRAQGRSTDSDEPLSYQLMADDMVALLDHLDIDSAHVVGWSDGGNTGLDMAIRYPDRVRSLVATGAQFRADGLIPDELEWVEDLTVDSFPPDWMDQCYRSVASEPDHLPIVIEKLRDMWLAEEYVPFDGLADIVAPVLVLEGTVPDWLLSEHVEDLAAAIPNAELTWIEDSGHFAPSEKAEEWNAAVLAFLDTVEADRLAAKMTEIEALVESTMEEAQIPGVALGIVKDGELVYAEGFGVAELGKDDPVTPQTVFHLASIGKTVVGTAVLQLVEQGKIDLDAPIVDYLPYFQLADEHYEEITVRQMLAHISGMPDVEDYEWDNPVYDDEAAERYVRSLNEFELLTPPGEEFAYSNMAYDLMGDVIAKASGQSFEEYVQENIFTPLGMENTTYLMPEADAAMLAAPHEIDDSGAVIVRDVYPYNRMHAPSSTLKSNVEDMARYAIAHMNHGELDGATILEPSSYDELWAEQAETGWGDNVNYYGLGWFVGDLDGHPVYHHLGADDGFNANFAVAPDDSIGVIVMLNFMDWETFEGDFHVSSIAEPAMKILLGVTE